MKLKYFFVITFISFNISFAYQIKPENRTVEYSRKSEYKNLINTANKYALENSLEKSLETAKKAYEMCPGKKEALLIMARVYNFKKDFSNLRISAEKILKISPGNYLGNIYLANSYMKEDRAKAREILEALLKKHPKDTQITEKLKALNEIQI
jgi:tetratricopeptide (TPR) repeat protein